MWKEEALDDLPRRTRKGHRQSDEHYNCFKGNMGQTSERRGGAYMGFSERIDTILNRTELSRTAEQRGVAGLHALFSGVQRLVESVVPVSKHGA